MSRFDIIRREFNQNMRLIEIGASYSPILPKLDGWKTTVIDHATKAELVAKYGAMGVTTVDQIEDVDYVWHGSDLSLLLPKELHGSFDGLVASHVGEHFPDLISFFKNAATLVKRDGLLVLALPDKRVCFDFFQPITMTGDLIDAHLKGFTRHRKRTLFNQSAYFCLRSGAGAWPHTGNKGVFQLANALSNAQKSYDDGREEPESEYVDCHAWTFTPKSFELLVFELNLLGYIDWSIKIIEPADAIEFYVWLERKTLHIPEAEVNSVRVRLLLDMINETKDAIAQMEEANGANSPIVEVISRPDSPKIAVICALYNGSEYIEETVHSIFNQTLQPYEVIVVNDGSTDNGLGLAIIDRLSSIYPIRLINKTNGGQSSARNLGVRESTADYIAFVDQDDVWYPSHLQKLLEGFSIPSESKIGWVYSDLDEIDDRGLMIHRAYLSTLGTHHPKRDIFHCIQEDMYILPSASLISRAAFDDVGGFDEQLCGYEDDDLFTRMFRKGYNNFFLKESLSKWRIYPTSTSYSPKMVKSRNVYARKLIAEYPDDPDRSRFYIRDLIVPRFVSHARHEYNKAVERGDKEVIKQTKDEWRHLASFNPHIAKEFEEYFKSLTIQKNNEFFLESLKAYKEALQSGDQDRIRQSWVKLSYAKNMLAKRNKRLRATILVMKNPTVARTAFAFRKIARKPMIWAFKS